MIPSTAPASGAGLAGSTGPTAPAPSAGVPGPGVAGSSDEPAPSRFPDPGFGAAFGAEWIKLRTARSTRRNVVIATVLGLALTALVAVVLGVTYDDLTAAERADFDPSGPALLGLTAPWLFLTIMAVKVVTSEHSSGMIRLTLTATPRRGRVLAAKALAVAALAWIVLAVSTAVMAGLTLTILAIYDAPTGGLADGDSLRALVGSVAVAPTFAVLAVAVAFLVRNTAAALGTLLGLVFGPSLLGMLPGWWQRNVVSLFLSEATDSISVGHIEPSDTHLHPIAAALVIAAWMAGALALAQAALSRRDA
jgi:ABC-2 type transport system permease protein